MPVSLFGGACAGLAGGYLSLAYTPQWIENMTGGRGWIALALVVFSTWLPRRLAIGAYLFGTVWIMGLYVQAAGLGIPSQCPVVAAISGNNHRSGDNFRQQDADQDQYAGLHRPAIRAGPLVIRMSFFAQTKPGSNVLQTGGVEMKKAKLMGLATALTMAVSLAGGAAEAKTKACWVYVGPVGDHGWSYQHDQGRQHVEKELGDEVETAYVENVAEGPDAVRAIERLGEGWLPDHLHHLVRLTWSRR